MDEKEKLANFLKTLDVQEVTSYTTSIKRTCQVLSIMCDAIEKMVYSKDEGALNAFITFINS